MGKCPWGRGRREQLNCSCPFSPSRPLCLDLVQFSTSPAAGCLDLEIIYSYVRYTIDMYTYTKLYLRFACVNRPSRPEGFSGYGYRGYSSLLWLSSPVHFISSITLYRPDEPETFEGEIRIRNDTIF